MKEITVAQLRQNPTQALSEVEDGETYVVTRHRRAIARLIPVEIEPLMVIPPRNPRGSRLADRPRDEMRSYAETEALLREMAADR